MRKVDRGNDKKFTIYIRREEIRAFSCREKRGKLKASLFAGRHDTPASSHKKREYCSSRGGSGKMEVSQMVSL